MLEKPWNEYDRAVVTWNLRHRFVCQKKTLLSLSLVGRGRLRVCHHDNRQLISGLSKVVHLLLTMH